jgi:hypothetical protein
MLDTSFTVSELLESANKSSVEGYQWKAITIRDIPECWKRNLRLTNENERQEESDMLEREAKEASKAKDGKECKVGNRRPFSLSRLSRSSFYEYDLTDGFIEAMCALGIWPYEAALSLLQRSPAGPDGLAANQIIYVDGPLVVDGSETMVVYVRTTVARAQPVRHMVLKGGLIQVLTFRFVNSIIEETCRVYESDNKRTLEGTKGVPFSLCCDFLMCVF